MDRKGEKLDINTVFTVLKPELDAVACEKTPTLYADLDRDFNNFSGHNLVSSYTFDRDWPEWEMHPEGDEIVMLMSGKAGLLIDKGNDRKSVVLEDPGNYVIIPRGTWHTAQTTVATAMLYITPGEGTEGRQV